MKSTIVLKTITALSLSVAFLASVGCASKNTALLSDPAYVQESKNLLSPVREQFQELMSGPAPLLVPAAYDNAKDSMKELEEKAQNGESVKKLSDQASSTTAKIEEARSKANAQSSSFQVALEARQQALAAGARDRQGSRLGKLDDEFAELGAQLERGRNVDSKEVSDLASQYVALTSKAALFSMGEARQRLELVKNQNAKKLVPTRLAQVESHYKSVEEFIKSFPSDQEGQSKQLESLARDIRKLQIQTAIAKQISEQKVEESAVKLEGAIVRLETAAEGDDQNAANSKVDRNESWVTRLDHVVAKTETALLAQGQLEKSRTELTATRQKLESAEGQAELSAKLKEVQSEFKPEEADVALSGQNIIVRLKSMQFPSGKATIESRNYDLLTRLGTAIKDAEPNAVTIQGHTDAVGSAALNRSLSEERAKAISEYLTNQKVAENIPWNSEGYGFDKPLASNKTKEGRATNRRIDVILSFQDNSSRKGR